MRDGVGSSLYSSSSPCPRQGHTRVQTAGLCLAFPGVWGRESLVSAFPSLKEKSPGSGCFWVLHQGPSQGGPPPPPQGHLGLPALWHCSWLQWPLKLGRLGFTGLESSTEFKITRIALTEVRTNSYMRQAIYAWPLWHCYNPSCKSSGLSVQSVSATLDCPLCPFPTEPWEPNHLAWRPLVA